MNKLWLLLVPVAGAVLSGCQSAGMHLEDVRAPDSEKTLSVGKVQREIRVGMTGGQVAEVLGSPNIVSTDENRHADPDWRRQPGRGAFDQSAHADHHHQI